MQIEINDIKKDIRDSIQKNLSVQIDNDTKHLLSPENEIIVADFLYVLRDLEEKYGTCIYEIFESENYEVFTVNNFAAAIFHKVTSALNRENTGM